MLMEQKKVPNTQNESKQTTQQEIDCQPIKDSFISLLIQPMLNKLLGVHSVPQGMQRARNSSLVRFLGPKVISNDTEWKGSDSVGPGLLGTQGRVSPEA